MRVVLGLVLALATATVSAASPTPAQVGQARALFGMDRVLDVTIDQALRARDGAGWTEVQRRCVAREVRPVFIESLDTAFLALFGTGENIDAWLAFGETPAGRKILDFVRDGVLTVAEGGPQPDPAQALGLMSLAEMRAVAEFLATPAGELLQKPFPAVEVPDGRLQALQPLVERACDVRFD